MEGNSHPEDRQIKEEKAVVDARIGFPDIKIAKLPAVRLEEIDSEEMDAWQQGERKKKGRRFDPVGSEKTRGAGGDPS